MVARLLQRQLDAMTRQSDYDKMSFYIRQNAPISIGDVQCVFPFDIRVHVASFLSQNPHYFLLNDTVSIQERS